jgi:hypothetical protein
MEGYGIKEGSMVIVNPAERVFLGCVAMVVYDERASIKKVYDTPAGKDLISSSGHKTHVTNEELSEDWVLEFADVSCSSCRLPTMEYNGRAV